MRYTKKCARTGIEFTTNSKIRTVHPKISPYTSNSDGTVRRAAQIAIQRGVSEGWRSPDRFIMEIEAEIELPSEKLPKYDLKGIWFAEITGSSKLFRFQRRFIQPIAMQGRFGLFALWGHDDGIYEFSCVDDTGEDAFRYYRLTNYQPDGGFDAFPALRDIKGVIETVPRSQVERMFPEVDCSLLPNDIATNGWEVIDSFLGNVGTLVSYGNQVWEIMHLQVTQDPELEDIASYVTYMRPATPSQRTRYYIERAELLKKTASIV